MRGMMRFKYLDLLIVALLAVLSLLAALVPAVPRLALQILSVLLVLLLPGYALTAAAVYRTLGSPERLAISVGLSLALASLGGLVLNETPWGLTSGAWRVMLAGITLLGVVVAAWRRQRDPLAADVRSTQTVHLRLRDAVLLGLTLLTLGLCISVARTGLAQQSSEAFTQFWAVPGPTLQLGVRNLEGQTVEYRVRVTAGTQVVAEWPRVSLQSDQQWVTNVVLPADAGQTPMEAQLYRADAPNQVYRSVHVAPVTQKQP